MSQAQFTKTEDNISPVRSSDRPLILFFFSLFFISILFFAFSNNLIYLAVILGVFFLVWFFIRPIFSLYLIALILSTTGLAFRFSGFELPLIDLVSLLALSAFFIRYFYIYFFTPRIYQEKIKLPYFFFFFLFFLAVIISSLLASDPFSSLWYFVRWILFLYLAYVVFPYNVVKTFNQLKKVLIFISISGIVLAGVGLASLFFQDFSDYFFRVQPIPIFGIWLFGENYNLMAEFLIISSFLLLALKYYYQEVKQQRIINLIFVLLLLVVFLSFGRTAWITVILQLLLYFFLDTFFFQKKKIAWKNFFLYLFILAILISPLFIKMLELQRANVSSTENRLLLSQIAWSSFLEKPLFGNGSGTFVSLVEDSTRFLAKYGEPLDSHGFVQKILAENGIFGLFSFLFLLLALFIASLKKIIKKPKYFSLSGPIFIAAFGGIFYQIFNTSYYKGRVWLPIALLLICVKLISNDEDE